MRPLTSLVPILPAAVGIPLGIVAMLVLPVWPAVVPVAVGVALYLIKKPWWAAASVFVAVGMLLGKIMTPTDPPPSVFGEKLHFSAVITSAEESMQTCRLIVDIDSVEGRYVRPFTAGLTVNSFEHEFLRGQRTCFTTTLSPALSPTELPGDLDLSMYYKSEGISALGYCYALEISVTAPASPLTQAFNNARLRIASAIVEAPLTPDCAAFLIATLLGDDTLLSPQVKSAFRAVGISHVLALSGLHVGIIVMIVMMLTLPFNALRAGFYIRPVLAIVLVWAYSMLVGMPASVVRAAIMTTVYMIARMLQNGHTGVNSLMISFVGILIFKPMWVFSAGFQLSVCAVASILAFTSLVPESWRRHPVRYYLLMSLIIPIAAMLGTGIISAYHFSTFPLLFLPANIAVGVIISWLLGLGVLVTLCSLAGWHLIVTSWIVNRLYDLLALCATTLSQLPGAQITGIHFPAIVIVPYAIALVFIWLAIKRKAWRPALYSAGCFTVAWLMAVTLRPTTPAAELYILHNTNTTKIVYSTHGRQPALILPDLRCDTANALKICNIRHQGYLNGRENVDTFTLSPTPRSLTIGSHTIRFLINSRDTIPDPERPTYLLVNKGYKGGISGPYRAIRPDTLLLSPALHPKVARRLTAECADSIPVINLRSRRFKIIIP